MLVDTHAHLYWDSYQSDLEQVLDRAKQNDVGLIINIGTDLETSKLATELQSDKIKMYATIGIHPNDGGEINQQDIPDLIEQLETLYHQHSEKIVAIGECGLDFSQGQNDNQLPLCKAQVQLAKKLNLPLIIHCRDAWHQIFIPELAGTRGVFHTFSGRATDAQKALALGYYLSFSCTLTYPKNEELRQTLKYIPLNKILTETDCPFLPPQQNRGQRNEPAYVKEVITMISAAKELPESTVIEAVHRNTLQLFHLNKYN